jgi:hypothetical protein
MGILGDLAPRISNHIVRHYTLFSRNLAKTRRSRGGKMEPKNIFLNPPLAPLPCRKSLISLCNMSPIASAAHAPGKDWFEDAGVKFIAHWQERRDWVCA